MLEKLSNRLPSSDLPHRPSFPPFDWEGLFGMAGFQFGAACKLFTHDTFGRFNQRFTAHKPLDALLPRQIGEGVMVVDMIRALLATICQSCKADWIFFTLPGRLCR